MSDSAYLRNYLEKCLLELTTEEGINASGKDGVYGCIFGRDSAITILKILNVHKKRPANKLLEIAKRTLKTLIALQGKEFNLESGEDPGKFIHEFRKDRYERLTKREKPWFVYADGKLRNYDSIDSTPLTLIAIYKYFTITKDYQFLLEALPAVEAGLNWIITYGDPDKDLFLEYELPPERTHGGLVVQSWTDSKDCIVTKDGKMPSYPIAPIEAQSYAWLALKLWADFYTKISPNFAQKLSSQAKSLKKKFNESFIIKSKGLYFGAQALDGNKKQIKTITANPLFCLWASYEKNGKIECIVEEKYINDFIHRAFLPDMFVKDAGIRTMSSEAEIYNPNPDSYHNGSFWPMLNGLIIEALEDFDHIECAYKLKQASQVAIEYFKSPIELYIKQSESFVEYKSPNGQLSCKVQAWSAASALDWLTE